MTHSLFFFFLRQGLASYRVCVLGAKVVTCNLVQSALSSLVFIFLSSSLSV